MDENTTLIAFKAISKFVRDLAEEFGKANLGLQLYNRLIEKTTIAHDKPVAKHVETFHHFCVSNREGILGQDLLTNPATVQTVVYSEKVNFNIIDVIRGADSESRTVIYRHLLTILALVDPASAHEAKTVLRGAAAASSAAALAAIPADSNEGKFLTDIISNVEKTIDPTQMTNPIQAVQSVLSSGVFTDMLGKMQEGMASGQLDIGKLMGTMTSVIGGMGGGAPNAGGADPMASMMSMLGPMMGPMMGALGGGAAARSSP